MCVASLGTVSCPSHRHQRTDLSMNRSHPKMIILVLALCTVSCDSSDSQDDFLKDATAPPSGITRTDASGQVVSEDRDDWRTAPFFVGKVIVDPAFPNPTPVGGTVTIPLRILQFEDLSGRLSLRVDVDDDFRLLDELLDTSSPGARIFQFSAAQINRAGLHRLFILDDFNEIVSYGDLLIE